MVAYTIERYLYFARSDIGAFSNRQVLDVALTRHLTIIASIASNAPYIGLLGTVLGILITFHDLSQGADLSASTIMLRTGAGAEGHCRRARCRYPSHHVLQRPRTKGRCAHSALGKRQDAA